MKQVRPSKLSNKHLSKKNKTVHRVYGGCLDHKVVRERYISCFFASVTALAWSTAATAGVLARAATLFSTTVCPHHKQQAAAA